ncbi:DUF4179 domain-containing protein [Clostridium thermosuccinogenes]|uniref:DUF4179 domain-containing protein n=1 Tax=Clostridium thermosuccinogenes TaxID=84032 RepID=UPI000CCC5F8B|nr:DUF4179 domain-containing protein [Pseudoclostridium thermosuccinogenes]PNT94036.1 hypothetical protein CDQ83_11310 [Pseudoclostridium thermosuccinogenes]
MFEDRYKSMYEQIVPDESLISKTIERINQQAGSKKSKAELYDTKLNGNEPYRTWLPKAKQSKGIRLFFKYATAAAVILVFTFAVMPAIAANVPVIYELMYMVSPSTAQFFMPVQKSCEDNGIRMEVVSTYIHGDTAEVYITLQDLTGNRVDETTDLYDSYSIHLPFDSSATCDLVGYDEKTRTATFLIRITQWGNRRIEGSKLTFSVGCFISGKRAYEDVPIKIDLSSVGKSPKTKETKIYGVSGPNVDKYLPIDKSIVDRTATVIVPSDTIYSPADSFDITGIGYVDGMLHIQFATADRSKNDSHGYFYLKDKDGNKILYDYSVGFVEYVEPGNEDTKIVYDEYIFDIPQDEISNYALYGSFYTSGLYTEGNWQVTFPLQSKDVEQ